MSPLSTCPAWGRQLVGGNCCPAQGQEGQATPGPHHPGGGRQGWGALLTPTLLGLGPRRWALSCSCLHSLLGRPPCLARGQPGVPCVPFEAYRGRSGRREQRPAVLQSPEVGSRRGSLGSCPKPPGRREACPAALLPRPPTPQPLCSPCRNAGKRGPGPGRGSSPATEPASPLELPRQLRAICPFRGRRVGEEQQQETGRNPRGEGGEGQLGRGQWMKSGPGSGDTRLAARSSSRAQPATVVGASPACPLPRCPPALWLQ